MSIIPKTLPPVRLPQLPPSWWAPAANTNAEISALEAAKRLGWRGIVGTGAEAAAEGIGATLWGVARIGLPILTLGLVMEGDTPRRSLRPSDFPKPQPDPQFIAELNLDFLKKQKTLAELSGNASLAQLLDIRIRGIEAQQTSSAPIERRADEKHQAVASAQGGNSAPVRKTAALDIEQLSPEDRQLWDRLVGRLETSPRSLYRFLIEQGVPTDHPLLATLMHHYTHIPGAAYAIAWYHMYRLTSHAPKYATMFNGVFNLNPDTIIKDIPLNHMPWFWDVLLTTVSRHRDPMTRRYALELTRLAMGYGSRQMDTFQAITEAGLQDPDPVNVWLTWRMLHQFLPQHAHAVTAQDLAPEVQLTVADNLQMGLAKYVYGTETELNMRHEIYMRIFDGCSVTNGEMSWLKFHPIHSLADFNPDPSLRHATVVYKQNALLKLLIQWHGNREAVLRQFLIGDVGREPDAVKVMVLPSGRAYLVQGHHRMAALIHMVLDGQLPADWLDHLPVRIMTYNGEIPEVIVRRVLTLGIDLEWADLFPQR